MYNDVIAAGVIVSILFSELTQLSPAGLVVPGYIVLCLNAPERIVYTFFIVMLTYAAAKLLGNFTILYGRRRFAVMILLSFVFNFLIEASGFFPGNPGIIGCIVPGIIAQEFERQGIAKSFLSLTIVVGVLAMLMLACGMPVF